MQELQLHEALVADGIARVEVRSSAAEEDAIDAYLRERGLQRSPNFAVVVQQQIDRSRE